MINDSTNERGIVKLLFAILLVFMGAVAYLFWYGITGDYTSKSVSFDAKLTDLFTKNGLKDSNIAERYQTEKKHGLRHWIEYYKKIKLPASINGDELTKQISELAKNNALTPEVSKNVDEISISISKNKIIISKLLFVSVRESAAPPSILPSKRRIVAIVIDDLGGKKDLSEFLSLGIPLTFAIMPYERFSKANTQELTRLKMPYIMHLPLEPEAYPKIDPGKAALLVHMSKDEITKKFHADLAAVPGISGISNHMGSRFSADAEKMKLLLQLVKETKLFYFDSHTTPKSVAKKVARELGMPCAQNDFFLDVEDTAEFERKQLELLLKFATRHGSAIAIGHIQKKHLVSVIKEYIPRFKEAGIDFVYLTEMYKHQ